jgi:hypothetical protein
MRAVETKSGWYSTMLTNQSQQTNRIFRTMGFLFEIA